MVISFNRVPPPKNFRGGVSLFSFWDRENERKKLREYILDPNPDSVMFIYGPKRSGKTSLVLKVLKDIKKEYGDLWKADIHVIKQSGRRMLTGDDLIHMLRKSITPSRTGTINISEDEWEDDPLFMEIVEELDVFVDSTSTLDIVSALTNKEGDTVLIFDGLDTRPYSTDEGEVDGVYHQTFSEFFELLNTLTTEMGAVHIVVTSSSLFMVDHVLRNHVLRNSSKIMSVDYFDDETAVSILVSEGISQDDADYFVKFVGGLPGMMRKILSSPNVRETVREIYGYSRMWIYELLRNEREFRKVFQRVLNGENLYYDESSFEAVRRLTDMGILYIDVLRSQVRFQSKMERNITAKLLETKDSSAVFS